VISSILHACICRLCWSRVSTSKGPELIATSRERPEVYDHILNFETACVSHLKLYKVLYIRGTPTPESSPHISKSFLLLIPSEFPPYYVAYIRSDGD
jgi:hypothetical protein